jgi:gliding motility-associated-like protein
MNLAIMEPKNPFSAFIKFLFSLSAVSKLISIVYCKAEITSSQKAPAVSAVRGILCAALFSFSIVAGGQVDGDYQTRASGTWSANTTWQVRAGGAWINCSAGDYPGATAGLGTVNILNGHTVTYSSGIPVTIGGNLAVNGGGVLAFDPTAARTLNINGNLSGGGTINMSPGNINHILNLVGTDNSIGLLTTSPTGASTVNYNRSGDQQVFGSPNYQNINISGGGVKSLQAGAAMSGILTVTNGILSLGSSDLAINNNSTNAVQGTFSAAAMIETGGTGALIRNAVTALPITFPVGSGGYFSPMNITAVSSTTGAIKVRAVHDATLGTTFINKYWDVITTTGGKTISATFIYDPAEINTGPTNIWYKPGSGSWLSPAGTATFGTNSFTISGTTNITTSSTFWTASALETIYTYQTGDWNTPNTWTSDPSGTLQTGNTVPGLDNKVVILSGRTVSLSSDISTQGLDIDIEAGGFLNMSANRFSNTLAALRGQGTLQLASVNFPNALVNTFVNSGGGTAEYNNAVNFTLPATQANYNNLTINTSGPVATQLSNLTLFGSLNIKSGTFRINDNVSVNKLTLTVNGDVTVDNGAFITVGNGATNPAIGAVTTGGTAPFINYYTYFHTVIIKGNFKNDGSVRFTNLTYPVYNAFPPTVAGATSGAASVYFQGPSDNTLTCNGTTDFYNLILDKGTDQTYKLTIFSLDYNRFRLFGANTMAGEGTGSNANLRKALWIRTGTLVLEGSLIIPSLTEGLTAGPPNSDFYIPSNGALILNGLDVVIFSTADDYREINTAYGVLAGDNSAAGISTGSSSALEVYGKLQVNEGYLSTRESGGIITSSTASGQIIIAGGTVDAKQFLSSTGAAQYTQTGGTFILRGRFQRTPAAFATIADLKNVSLSSLNTSRTTNGINPAFGSFNLENPANIFSMSGGIIRIYDVCGIGVGEEKAFDVKSTVSNINVTGGTLEIIPVTGSGSDAVNISLTTNAPLNNLLINRTSGASIIRLNTPLVVLNNLNLASGDLNANSNDISVGGNFTIEAGTSYTTGTNATIFNGAANQIFTINLVSALSLNNLTVDKPAGIDLEFAGTQKTVNINNNFRLVLATLMDNGNIINVYKDVFNSGIYSGTGKIVFSGTSVQQIDGNGIFNNVELNNNTAVTAPVYLSDNMTLNGRLTFSIDRLFNIGIYNLTLNSAASIANGSPTRYIQTAGNSGDGGLTKVYSSTLPFLFPVGAQTLIPVRPVKYTPAKIGFSTAPATYGSVTVIPVGYEHPATTINGQSLTYYWRIKSSGFTGIEPNTVTHTFVYDQSDVVGTESSYIPSIYDRVTYTWTTGLASSIDIAANSISDWNTSKDFLDADYTAGISAFSTATKFYSIANGVWNSNSTWSYTSGGAPVPSGTVPGINIPGPNSIVIIENNNTVNLTANQSCASLQIKAGSTLDIYTWTGSVFGMVLSHPAGNGLFRLTTTITSNWRFPKVFSFPTGDFSDFNANNGTTEFYDIDGRDGLLYILPQNVTSYGNLMVTAKGGDNLILPNNTLTTINGNLTIGGDNIDAWISMSWSTAHNGFAQDTYGPIIEKTVHVTGNMFINTGKFIFMDEYLPQHLVVDGNITVNKNAWIDVFTPSGNSPGGPPQANTISLGGDLINNSDGYGRLLNDNYYCDLILQGTNNTFISGSSPLTIFNKVIVNKGTSQETTLTCDIGGSLSTPTNNWLTLQNGTFRYMRANPNSDFTISTTTPFVIPATAGLYIDYSNTSSRNILIGNNPANNNDLFLDGKLTLVSGNVYVGPIFAPANNNDIEYSGGGASAIEVKGGILTVNGQIRRPAATTNGILSYTQSGGNVNINGNNTLASKAKLEVLNDGSRFDMSGGTITIVHGGGTIFGDLYLRPGTSTVTGGNIIFSHNITGKNQTYGLDANIPLNNITITGRTAATAANATVNLMVSPLELNGSLTLSNISSIFNSNNLNVSLKGDLNNNGNYIYGTNTTTFNGGFQSVTGTSVTNFFNLDVLPVNSLTVNNNFTVKRNLTIDQGNLVLGSNKVTLFGDLINNGSYTDNNTGSGISLSGTSQQQITGSGAFGRLELNNVSGAIVNSDISLHNDLVLTLGILDINKNQLTLSQNSIIGGAPFDVTRMIKSDGVISNLGVLKFFTPSPQSFVFPVGVTGKYTPASFTILASEAVGSIGVNPVNNKHSSITDPTSALNYYWQIKSSGITGFYGNILLQYKPEDVQGVESDYVAAKLLLPGNYWDRATPGPSTDNVDETSHRITFIDFDSNNLTGDYTAGSDAAFPAEVPTYRSVKDGNWSDLTTWTPVGSSPSCPAGGPNGGNVIIDNIVTADINNIFALSTTINNRLIIDPPIFNHNLGVVDGDGTIYLKGGNLPAGNYDAFVDCSGNGTIEYGGTGTYTIIATLFNNVPNMFFTGTGIRILPNKDLTICKRLVIDGPTLDNSVNRSKLTILGTMERYNTGAFISGIGRSPASTVSFAGQAVQTLGGITGDFSGTNRFNNLEINNPSGLNIGTNGLIEVDNELLLTRGIVNTSLSNKLVLWSTSSDIIIPDGGSTASFINGPLIKKIINGGSFLYPLGNGTIKGHNFTLTSTAGSTLFWNAECFMPNLTATSLTDPLKVTSKKEFWGVNTTIAGTAKIKIAWDQVSDVNPLVTLNGISDMRVAEFTTGSWRELPPITSGDFDNGDVATANDVSIPLSSKNFTTGSVTMTRPRASFAPAGPICGADGIPVSFSSFNPIDLNYTLDYTINGVPQPTITVTSTTFVLPTPVPGAYKLTGFTYHTGNVINTGVVNRSIVNVYAKPTDANAGADRSLCGVSGLTLAANNPAPYSGLWTKVSGAGGTFINNTQKNTDFTGILGKTYVLRWTISNFSCTSSDDVIISFPVEAAKPSNFMSAPSQICQGSGGYIYTVPAVSGNTYNWTYSGTGQTINGTGNSVTIDFNTTATSGTLSVTATNVCGTSAPRTIAITVNTLPAAITGPDRNICQGIVTTLGAAPVSGNSYQWSSVPAGFNSTVANPVASPLVTTTYTLVETNTASGCTKSNSVVVTVIGSPVATGNNGPVCIGNQLQLTGPSGMTTYSWTGPNGFTSTIQSPVVSANASLAMAGSYIVTVTNSSGCSGTATTVVSVKDLPIPGLISSDPDNMFCSGTRITFTASGGTSYNFRINSTGVQDSEVATYSTTSLSDGQIVDVIVTNAPGCSATSPGIVNKVIPLPTATLVSSDADNTFCTGASVTFTAGGGTSYNFRVNGTSVQDGVSSTYTTTSLTNGQIVDVIVTDGGSCSAVSTGITNIVNNIPAATGSQTNVLCFGAATGSINITTAGGTGPYTFAWTGPGVVPSSEDQSNLAAGSYSVIVTDVTGCKSASFPVIITQPLTALSVNIISQTNVSAFGNSDGAVTVAGSGGTSPYQYKTGGGIYQDSGTFGSLAAGTYTITMRDINLCTFDITVTVTQPPEPLSGKTTSIINVPCFGTSTGSVTVTGSGGKPPYEYKLGTGSYQSSGTFGNLATGSYTVTVRDTELSAFDVNFTITQPSVALGGSISSLTNVLCYGSSTGGVTVTGSGGTSPYNYKIGSGSYQSAGTFGSLAAGNYTITVQDANNCTFNIPLNITQPPLPFAGSISTQTNVSCFGLSNGTVTVSGSGGTAPYLYSFNGGPYQASATFSGLPAGAYTITIYDVNLCTTNVSATVTQPVQISIAPVTDNASCPGNADGNIRLTITGGGQPYRVIWSDGILTSDRLNIPDGTYSVVVTDINGCNASLDIPVGVTGSEACIEIPAIITPNNDGYNDTWKIKNIELFPDAEVFVYTRWGQLVYNSKNIAANPWDGTFKGELLPTDSYHYILHLSKELEPRTGVVSIIR